MRIKKCEICGKTFETNRPNKKYCSFTCKEAGEKLWRLKWQDKNPEYQKLYQRAYRERKRLESEGPRTTD